jgi:hypothetical protein
MTTFICKITRNPLGGVSAMDKKNEIKELYEAPALDICEFRIGDVIATSDDDVIELPKQEFSW